MSITIRTLGAGEAALLKRLYLEMSLETPTAYGDRPDQIAEWSDEKWQEMAATFATSPVDAAFVAESAEGAESSGGAAGFVAAHIFSLGNLNAIMGQPTPDNPDDPSDTTLLTRMWVASDRRGQGLAQQLIQRVLEWAKAKAQDRVVLGVTDNNERAYRCYVRVGFAPLGMAIPHPGYKELNINVMAYQL